MILFVVRKHCHWLVGRLSAHYLQRPVERHSQNHLVLSPDDVCVCVLPSGL